MIKKWMMAALAAALILTMLPMGALAAPGDTGTTADGLGWQEQADGMWITGYTGSAAALVIPGSINGIDVTQIGNGAFLYNTTITSVTLPDSVTTLQNSCFSHCSNLQSVTFGSGLTSLGSSVFRECTSLESMALPNTVTAMGTHVFESCTNLTSVTLPNQITSIPDSTFYGTAITSIAIPDTVQSIGLGAFAHSSIQSISTPVNCTSIGQEAFTECASLTSADLAAVETIGQMAFYNCTSLTSLTLSDTLRIVSANAFYNCRFTSLVLPESLENAAFRSFGGNTALTTVTIQGSPIISEQVFSGCTNLSKAYIISTDAVFGLYIFYLTRVEEASPATNGIYGFAGSTAQTYAGTNYPLINFHPCVLVSFEEGGGSAVSSQFITVNSTAAEPAAPTRDGHIFGGWYTTGALETEYDFSAPVTSSITLYAKWTELTLSSSVASGTIYTGGRITLTPNIEGGEWTFDSAYFSREGGTFTGLRAGTSTIIYTVSGVSVTYDVTIEESGLPGTGQDMTWVWALIGTALIAFAAAGVLVRRSAAKSR